MEARRENQTQSEKYDTYLELLGMSEPPDAIVVIDAGISSRTIKNPNGSERMVWGPTSYSDEKIRGEKDAPYTGHTTEHGDFMLGVGGGKAAAIAGEELWSAFPEAPIVVTSQVPNIKTETGLAVPTDHWPYYQQYIERLTRHEHFATSPEFIPEMHSTTTLEGMLEFLILAEEHNWQRPVLISNRFRIGRTLKFLEILADPKLVAEKLAEVIPRLPTKYQAQMGAMVSAPKAGERPVITFYSQDFFTHFAQLDLRVITAEDILEKRDLRYAELFKKVAAMPEYQKRVAMEQRGTQRLEDGTYGSVGSRPNLHSGSEAQ